VTSENHGIILDRVGARVFVTSLPSFYAEQRTAMIKAFMRFSLIVNRRVTKSLSLADC
jgi:hypothetical protein